MRGSDRECRKESCSEYKREREGVVDDAGSMDVCRLMIVKKCNTMHE